MATTFDDWLAQLAAAGQLASPMVATRGRALSYGVVLDGDYTGAALAGKVRLTPDAAGSPLATFTVTGPVVASGKTRFTLTLAASVTMGLPADADANGVEEFAYDITLTPSGGSAGLLVGGIFSLLGSVT